MSGTNIRAILSSMPSFDSFHDRISWLSDLEYETRDSVVNHSEGVSHQASSLAQFIGFSGKEVRSIAMAARWHDIGKLATPDEILHSTDKLSDDQFAVMKAHARDGARLLGNEAPQVWKDIIQFHHERYDGAGYEGLKGEQIPLVARIVAIADVHDALMERRGYKEGMSEEAALLVMTGDEETPSLGRRAFDPFLLRRFVMMRLTDPAFRREVSQDAFDQLLGYVSSSPMSDFPNGFRDNDGWKVSTGGHRKRYQYNDRGNHRLVALLSPLGEAKPFRGEYPSEASYRAQMA